MSHSNLIVIYLQRLFSIEICLSSIIFGICLNQKYINSLFKLSTIQFQQITNKEINHLFDFNLNFINQQSILFIITSILSILLSISAIFYLDLKRLNRAIFYVVLNFLFVVVEIALITLSFLSLNKFQIHNQMIINSIKKYNNTDNIDNIDNIYQIIIFINNSSQTQIISIICLFIALSILKFVTIPITLFTLWPFSSLSSLSSSSSSSFSIDNQEKQSYPRLSNIKYPKPPPRSYSFSLPINNINNVIEGDRYPSIPSSEKEDSEILYINKKESEKEEGLFINNTTKIN